MGLTCPNCGNEKSFLAKTLQVHVVQAGGAELELSEQTPPALLELLCDDIRYWMPLARNAEFGHWDTEYTEQGKDLNWFDEGKFELEQRVNQLLTGKHWAEEPMSRTSGSCPKAELKPSFQCSSPSSIASIRTGAGVVIWIVEAVAVCLDTVSLHCGLRYTRRFTAAAFLAREPMRHRL